MLKRIYCFILFYFHVKESLCIVNGRIVETEKRFVVYLLKAPQSNKQYIAWLCGGTILTNRHVLTSAACLRDVHHVYVIPGYNKYVSSHHMEQDECIKRKRRRIVHYCTHSVFHTKNAFDDKIDWWNWGDIAVATVDIPFNFWDNTYRTYCTYPPAAIPVNLQPEAQKPGTSVLLYGWGHARAARPINDTRDYNERYLRYAAGAITSAQRCKDQFGPGLLEKTRFNPHYPRYLICIFDYGNIDERGNEINRYGDLMDDCLTKYIAKNTTVRNTKLRTEQDPEMTHRIKTCMEKLQGRQGIGPLINPADNDLNHSKIPGICQNDHGGPLTTWRGGKEIVIGVASMYAATNAGTCRPPFGFTSTSCVNKFIVCATWPTLLVFRCS